MERAYTIKRWQKLMLGIHAAFIIFLGLFLVATTFFFAHSTAELVAFSFNSQLAPTKELGGPLSILLLALMIITPVLLLSGLDWASLVRSKSKVIIDENGILSAGGWFSPSGIVSFSNGRLIEAPSKIDRFRSFIAFRKAVAVEILDPEKAWEHTTFSLVASHYVLKVLTFGKVILPKYPSVLMIPVNSDAEKRDAENFLRQHLKPIEVSNTVSREKRLFNTSQRKYRNKIALIFLLPSMIGALGALPVVWQHQTDPAFQHTRDIKTQADGGNADAQNKLGWRYATGTGVFFKSDQDAVYWYKKAAEQQYPKALYNLGLAYANRRGVKRDYEKAFSYFLEAANRDFTQSYYFLGLMYEKGYGIQKSVENAAKYYELASQSGDKRAEEALNNLKS